MSKRIVVQLNGQEVKTKTGTSAAKLLESYPHPGELDPIGCIINNRMMSLHRPLVSNCTVNTVDYSSKEGANIYRRTVQMLLYKAFYDLYPKVRLEIGQSLADGYYFDANTHDGPLTVEMLAAVENRMQEIVAADWPIRVSLVTCEEAEEFFSANNYPEKVLLIRQRNIPEIPWVVMGDFRFLCYGPMAPSTGSCKLYSLLPKLPGFVLSFPNRKGEVHVELPPQPKLFSQYRETKKWNEMMGVLNVGQLNQACIDGSISEIIKVSEGLQEKKIVRIADEISEKRDKVRLVLIAGPSSSGKTTSTKRLAIQLQVNGIRPVMISMDNYYVNRSETPLNEDGSYNFECLEALDFDLFNHHLRQLLDGEEVKTPVFDFVRGERRKDKYKVLKLEENQVVIVEGIHGLNPKLTSLVSNNEKFKIYLSALTQLRIDGSNRIFTSDARLLRRIVRDRLFRGYLASQTIHMWPSVRDGENKYIFPFQEEADVMFDTALVYEQAVLKPYLKRYLMEVPPHDEAYVEAYRLFKFLDLFIPVFPHEVPPTSILREFIGGSSFDY